MVRRGKKSWFPDHLIIFTNKGINRIEQFGIFFYSRVPYFMDFSQMLLQTSYARKLVFTHFTVKNFSFLLCFHSYVLLKISRSCKIVSTCVTLKQNLLTLTDENNMHSTRVFHHHHPHITRNLYVIRSFFLISPTEKPPKINFGPIALLSEPIGSVG